MGSLLCGTVVAIAMSHPVTAITLTAPKNAFIAIPLAALIDSSLLGFSKIGNEFEGNSDRNKIRRFPPKRIASRKRRSSGGSR
jgi:hypothetical protein